MAGDALRRPLIAPSPAAKPIGSLLDALRRRAMASASPDNALGLARIYGYLLRINECGIYDDDALEAELTRRFAGALEAAADAYRGDTASFDWLHVISDAYAFGGHTRLLERWLAVEGGRDAKVVVTNAAFDGFAGRLPPQTQVVLAQGSALARAGTVLRLGRSARHIVFHISPEDISSALAARRLGEAGHSTYFVNHADHCFSFGLPSAGTVLEVSGFGWALTERKRAHKKQYMLGIPLGTDGGDLSPLRTSANLKGPIVSAGSWSKFEPSGQFDFAGFLNRLLPEVEQSVVIVGPSGQEPWWGKMAPHHRRRIEFPGMKPRGELQQIIRGAACYIDSFPMTGGTLFSEALLLGTPVFGPPVPVAGYSLADALRAQDIERLALQVIDLLRSGQVPAGQSGVRQRIEAKFGRTSFGARIAALAAGGSEPLWPELRSREMDIAFFEKKWAARGRVQFAIPSGTLLDGADRLAVSFAALRAQPAELKQGQRAFSRWLLSGRS